MTTVEFTVGLPASGKTTYAKQRVAESGGNLRRVNMDDLRAMLGGDFSPALERAALKLQDQAIIQAVRDGLDVIVDNTHITKRMPERIRAALSSFDVTWKVTDFLGVPPDECVARDAQRAALGQRSVGSEVILRMANRTRHWKLTEQWLNDYPKPERYEPPQEGPRAVICDLDGTLAIHQGRSPYDTARCGEDACDEEIAQILDFYADNGAVIILVSGRDANFRPQTQEWLHRYSIAYDQLLMRPEGDVRRDDVVKAEIFDKHIRGNYRVLFCLDDRNRVVDMWRSMGLKTWQVAEGDF